MEDLQSVPETPQTKGACSKPQSSSRAPSLPSDND